MIEGKGVDPLCQAFANDIDGMIQTLFLCRNKGRLKDKDLLDVAKLLKLLSRKIVRQVEDGE